MLWISKKVSKKYVMCLSGFHMIRKFKDGISFFEFVINHDLFKGDHNPHFRIMLIFLNFKVFEFEVYNIYHKEEVRVEERSPCSHPGCRSHVTHPCEGCGQQWN